MRHGGRVRHQALDAAERLGQEELLQPVEEGLHRRFTAGQLEADHAAEALLLAGGNRMAWMRLEARVVHPLDRRVRHQYSHQRRGVLGVGAQPRRQRADAAQREEAVEGRARQAQAVGPPVELLVQLRRLRHHRAADHVAVAVQVLGGRVQHDIGAVREGGLPAGRQEGVVRYQQRVVRAAQPRDRVQVGNAQQRVARRLDQHHARAVREGGRERRRIGLVHEGEPELAACRQRGEQPVRAAVTVVRRQQQVLRSEQLADQRDRRHAGAGHHRAGAAFQRGQRLAERVAGGLPERV
jgi:hypothetical protein